MIWVKIDQPKGQLTRKEMSDRNVFQTVLWSSLSAGENKVHQKEDKKKLENWKEKELIM